MTSAKYSALTVVKTRLPAVSYIVLDWRVSVSAKLYAVFTIPCANPLLWPVRMCIRLNRLAMPDLPSFHYHGR